MRNQTCTRLLDIFRAPGEPSDPLVKRKTWIRAVLISSIIGSVGYWGLSKGAALLFVPDLNAGEESSVLVASRYVPAYSLVKPQTAVLKTFPSGFAPPGALHTLEELVDSKGRPLYMSPVPLPEGQPLTRAALVEVGKSRGMASLLSPGKVAASFAVDRVRGVGGWIQPGDRIAVYQTLTDSRVRLLFPALLVLAVDKTSLRDPLSGEQNKDSAGALLGSPEESGAVLTVLLNTFEAESFMAAIGRGPLTAALRAIGDELMEVPHGP